MMLRSLIPWHTLTLLCAVSVQATAQDPKARATLVSQAPAWIGQRIPLVVELLAPGYFAGAAAFDLPNPPGILLLPPEAHPTVASETIDGVSYSVQRHELSLLSRRAGETTIPAIKVRFRFKREPLDRETIAAAVQTSPLEIIVKTPPGAEQLGSVVSARELSATETWQPALGKAKAGDAFTRTITFTAIDLPAMAFPPLPITKIDGLGIYPKEPVAQDKADRGTLRGMRTETVTYVCERPGEFVIPAVRLTWFDLDSEQLRRIDLPADQLVASANPALAISAPEHASGGGNSAPHNGLLMALGANAFALVLWLTRSVWQPLCARLQPVHLAPLNPSPRSAEPHSSP